MIEFNGTYWHADPRKYLAEDVISRCKKTAREIWNKDQHKIEIACKQGYKVYIIWEMDWLRDKVEILYKLKRWLNANI